MAARAALLAYLEGELPLDEAARKYISCFPPLARMSLDQLERTWKGWSPARKRDMARHIRLGMAGLQSDDEE